MSLTNRTLSFVGKYAAARDRSESSFREPMLRETRSIQCGHVMTLQSGFDRRHMVFFVIRKCFSFHVYIA